MGLKAKDLMHRRVYSIREDASVAELIEVLIREHIHGAPVVDGDGHLVGVVTQQDVFFSTFTRGSNDGGAVAGGGESLKIRDIMTSPPICASEDTDLMNLCRMMHRLRIHRVPIVRKRKLTGIISSLDICGAIAGEETPPPGRAKRENS
jgi:CBS domain-containing protein